MSEIKSYKDLLIWQKGMELTQKTYELTKTFPSEEIYGLTSQIRRSSVSIPSNITEGYGRNSNKNFVHYLNISKGSLFELETQLLIAKNLGYIQTIIEDVFLLIEEVGKMINSFIRKINI